MSMAHAHAPEAALRHAHIVVVGNQKGGAGKSTVAMHLIVALMRMGRRVGALDTWIGYHPQLEAAILPQTDKLAAEIETLLAF